MVLPESKYGSSRGIMPVEPTLPDPSPLLLILPIGAIAGGFALLGLPIARRRVYGLVINRSGYSQFVLTNRL